MSIKLASIMTLLAILTMGLIASPIQARQSDLSQPVDVRADQSEYDEKAGTQTLSGNVEISQGTMRIKADKITISLKNNALHEIRGIGSPIHFEQENDAGELMQGQAQRIVYNATAGTLTLAGGAKLSQPRQNLTSERITFNARTQKVSAEGSDNTGRVNIQLLPPQSVKSQ